MPNHRPKMKVPHPWQYLHVYNIPIACLTPSLHLDSYWILRQKSVDVVVVVFFLSSPHHDSPQTLCFNFLSRCLLVQINSLSKNLKNKTKHTYAEIYRQRWARARGLGDFIERTTEIVLPYFIMSGRMNCFKIFLLFLLLNASFIIWLSKENQKNPSNYCDKVDLQTWVESWVTASQPVRVRFTNVGAEFFNMYWDLCMGSF